MSISEEIDQLRFVDLKSRATAVSKVVRVGHTTILLIKPGVVHCSRVKEKFAYPAITDMEEVIIGLFKLGCISKKAMDEHNARSREIRELSSRKYAAEGIVSNAKVLGIALTHAQLAAVSAASPQTA